MAWQKVVDRVWMYQDSCRVYAILGNNGFTVINAGTGEWLSHVEDLPAPVRTLMCTHFFRDHSAGVTRARQHGIRIMAPYWEQEQFGDPLGLFQRRETFIIYDNQWDLFAPVQPLAVDEWLADWEEKEVDGTIYRVIPTPGVTLGAVSLLCDVGGKRICFCGEAICAPGKIYRLAPLQYDYNGFPGALQVIWSSRFIRDQKPDILAPSMGYPMLEGTEAALSSLESNLRNMLSARRGYDVLTREMDDDPLIRVSDSVYQSRFGSASTWFIVSGQKALAIDYGYHNHISASAGYAFPRNRRSCLHGLDGLEKLFGIKTLDVVLVTHFHDDHVNGIPMLQRIHGTRCWAGENFAHILNDPMGYNFPCTWPERMDVEPQSLEKPIEWEGISFTLYPMTGHTRWSTLVVFEADGLRFAATGDQYFFHDMAKPGKAPIMPNYVYRNGAMMGSIDASNALMESIKPDMILPGHGRAYGTNTAFFDELARYAEDYREHHKNLMPLNPDDVHFELDSRMGWLEPYRAIQQGSRPIEFKAVVRNPLGREAELRLRLTGPEDWEGEEKRIAVPARSEGSVFLSLRPAMGCRCRRQPVTLEMFCEERPFGQVAEALVTIGHPVF